jgi:glutathione synthase
LNLNEKTYTIPLMTPSNKNISLGIVMDPITSICPKKDSSFALLLEAQHRNWAIFYMEPKDLLLEDNSPKAYMRTLTVWDRPEHWFELGDEGALRPLSDLSVIFMRLDPPVNQAYLHITQLLSLAEESGTWIINKPQSLRDYNEKLLALQFPECCPPTLVTQSKATALQFLEKHQDVIVKPLDGMGGQAIFRLHAQDPNKHVIFETLSARKEQYFLIQRYLPEIQHGDKRIILINGTPIPYALARMPAIGETRANLAAGGRGVAVPLTERDLWICKRVAPFLCEKGLIWVGLDVIGDYLTEINITSPTCIRELDTQCHLNIGAQLLEYIEHQFKSTC